MDDMNEQDALKQLSEIKALMRGTASRAGRNAGWFFILWGVIWAVGFTATQLLGDGSRFVWLGLNLFGIALTAYLVRLFFGGRTGQRVTGLGRRIALMFAGFTVFDLLLALLLGITSSRDITLLIILSAGTAYVIAGIVAAPKTVVLGILLWLAAVAGRLAAPEYLPLVTAVSGGGAFLAVGISFLVRKKA